MGLAHIRRSSVSFQPSASVAFLAIHTYSTLMPTRHIVTYFSLSTKEEEFTIAKHRVEDQADPHRGGTRTWYSSNTSNQSPNGISPCGKGQCSSTGSSCADFLDLQLMSCQSRPNSSSLSSAMGSAEPAGRTVSQFRFSGPGTAADRNSRLLGCPCPHLVMLAAAR